MSEIAELIGNFGFPIALVIYLFTRFEKRLTEAIETIEKLEETIQETTNKIIHKGEKDDGK